MSHIIKSIDCKNTSWNNKHYIYIWTQTHKHVSLKEPTSHSAQLKSPAPQQLAPLISLSGTKETRSDYTEERKKIPEIWIIILNFLKYFNFTLMCFPREKCAPLPPFLLIHLQSTPPFPWNIWKKIPNLYFQLFLKVWNFNYSNQLRGSLPLPLTARGCL